MQVPSIIHISQRSFVKSCFPSYFFRLPDLKFVSLENEALEMLGGICEIRIEQPSNTYPVCARLFSDGPVVVMVSLSLQPHLIAVEMRLRHFSNIFSYNLLYFQHSRVNLLAESHFSMSMLSTKGASGVMLGF